MQNSITKKKVIRQLVSLSIMIVVFLALSTLGTELLSQSSKDGFEAKEKKVKSLVCNIKAIDSAQTLDQELVMYYRSHPHTGSIIASNRYTLIYTQNDYLEYIRKNPEDWSLFKQIEIVEYYKEQLVLNGWSDYEHRVQFNASNGSKISDIYRFKRDGYNFKISFNVNDQRIGFPEVTYYIQVNNGVLKDDRTIPMKSESP